MQLKPNTGQAHGDSCGSLCIDSMPVRTVLVTPAYSLSPAVIHSDVALEIVTRVRIKTQRCELFMGKTSNGTFMYHSLYRSCISNIKLTLKICLSNASWIWARHASVIVSYINKIAWTYKQNRIWTWTLIKQCCVFLLLLAKPYFGL